METPDHRTQIELRKELSQVDQELGFVVKYLPSLQKALDDLSSHRRALEEKRMNIILKITGEK